MFRIAVAGAHLSGFPLNQQLTILGAQLVGTVNTAGVYRMYDLGGIKPALIRQPPGVAGVDHMLTVMTGQRNVTQ